MHRKAKLEVYTTRREMLQVGNIPDHTLMLTELEGYTVEYILGIAGEFVYRRSVGVHDRVKGDGRMHGYFHTV